MTFTIPTERLGNVVLDERDAVVDIAIGLYKRQMVSLGRAAEVAGMASPEFLAELGRRRIPTITAWTSCGKTWPLSKSWIDLARETR